MQSCAGWQTQWSSVQAANRSTTRKGSLVSHPKAVRGLGIDHSRPRASIGMLVASTGVAQWSSRSTRPSQCTAGRHCYQRDRKWPRLLNLSSVTVRWLYLVRCARNMRKGYVVCSSSGVCKSAYRPWCLMRKSSNPPTVPFLLYFFISSFFFLSLSVSFFNLVTRSVNTRLAERPVGACAVRCKFCLSSNMASGRTLSKHTLTDPSSPPHWGRLHDSR